VYKLATPNQVLAALACDLAAAARSSRGKATELSKAVIDGALTFTLVGKDSLGATLAVGAIPVFSQASVAPSLDAQRLTSTSESNVYTFTVDPAALQSCEYSSLNNWLTSRAMIDQIGGIRVGNVKIDVSFVLTTKFDGGLKLNIIPVTIGPQASSSSEHTQKVSLTFDFTKKPAAASSIPAQPSGGAFKFALVDRGRSFLDKKEWDEAIAQFNEALRIDPEFVPALKNRGAVYLGTQDYNRAIADYDAAIRLEPKYAEHYYNRAQAYLGVQDYNPAIADFTKAIDLKFYYKADALYWRGVAMQKNGDGAGGEADIAEARRIDPKVGS
jgi:tetratricopeptide (TPR) repeat protein